MSFPQMRAGNNPQMNFFELCCYSITSSGFVFETADLKKKGKESKKECLKDRLEEVK